MPTEPIATLGKPAVLTTRLEAPWGLTFLPDGSALVSERLSERILRIPAGGGDAQPVGVVPGVEVSSDGGLLGIVASPAFEQDHIVYASVSGTDDNRIVALKIADDLGSLVQDRVLLDGIQTADITTAAGSRSDRMGTCGSAPAMASSRRTPRRTTPSTTRPFGSGSTAPSRWTTPGSGRISRRSRSGGCRPGGRVRSG